MEDLGMLMIKAIVFGMIFMGVGGFVLVKYLSRSTDFHVNRLNRETEAVREKQAELNDKIKAADQELAKRREQADELVAKMKADAEETARSERDKIVKKAREEAEEIILKAERSKDDIRKVLETEMEMKAIDFSVILLTEIFSEKVRQGLNKDMISEFLESLKDIDMDMIGADIVEAEIETAVALPQDILDELASLLKSKLGRTITIKTKQEPKVLAGIVLYFGSLRLDGSVANLMKEKGVEMKERLERGIL